LLCIERIYNMGGKSDGGKGELIAQSREFAEKARQALEKVDLPDITKQELALKYPELILSAPEEKLGDTALSLIQEDPELQRSQDLALEEMQQLGQEGFSTEDKAKFEAMRRTVAGDEQARQQSILADMSARGAGGSGAELAARLSSGQAATERASIQGEQMAAENARARREALMQAGQMASNQSQQDYAKQANKASAKDQIAAFNAQVSSRDTDARRQQQGQKIQTQNTQQQYNKELGQRDFQNQMAKQGGIANAYSGQASNAMAAAGMTKPKKGSGGMIGTLVGAGLGAALTSSPQGASVGASVGGSVGSQFASGGIKGKTYAAGGSAGMYGSGPMEAEVSGTAESEMSPEDKQKYLEAASIIAKNLVPEEESQSRPMVVPTQQIVAPQQAQFQGINPAELLKYRDGGMKNEYNCGGTKKGMAYDDGGEGTIIDSGMESYSGDELPDRINDGEMVHNLHQQDRLNELLKELGERRVDEAVDSGNMEVNENQQEDLMSVVRGEKEPEDMEDENIVESRGMKRLLQILGSKR